MELRITARHTRLPPDVKAYVEEKAEKLSHYFDGVSGARLILAPDFVSAPGRATGGRTGPLVCAELVVTLSGEHAPLVAEAKGETFRAAVDLVLEKTERQLRRHKEKLRERRARGP